MDMQVVWSQPRAHQAVRFPDNKGGHQYSDDADFLLAVAEWIVRSGGECTLRYVDEQPGPDESGVYPHIELLIPCAPDDGDEGPCEVALEPGWWVIHFGHGNFAFIDPEWFGDQFSVDPPAAVGTIEDGLLPAQPTMDVASAGEQWAEAVLSAVPGEFDPAVAVDMERSASVVSVGIEGVEAVAFDPAAAVDSDRATPDDTHGWTPGGDQ